MNNLNDLDISLLGFISAMPMHGYELHKQVTDLSGFGIVWKIKIGKLYSLLNKLEKEGLIKSTFAKEGNRPARNKFLITPEGKNIYDGWLISPVNRGRDFRIIFLLKLFFSLKNGIEYANQLIASQINTCNIWLSDMLLLTQKDLISKNRVIDSFSIIVNNYRQTQIKGYLAWLEWCKEFIKRD